MRPKTLCSALVASALAALAGNAVDVGPAGAAATASAPDLKVALKQAGPYTGDNLIAPPSQVIEKQLKIRRRKDVWLRAQNDGDPGQIRLFADPGDATLKLKYFQGSDEVTNLITGSGLTLSLANGQETTIRISVKAKPGQQDEDFFIDAESLENSAATDSVGFHLDIKPFD